MKNITMTFAAAIALAAIAMSFPQNSNAQSTPQSEWNEQYRSEFEVPVGKHYTGRSPYMGRMVRSTNAPAAKKAVTPAKVATPVAPTKATNAAPAAVAKSDKAAVVAKPEPAPAKKAAATTASAPATKPGCSEGTSGLIRLGKTLPADVSLGAEFVSELTVTAQGCAGNVVVRDSIPAGASYVRSEPTATVDGNQLVWNVGNMEAGQVVKTKVVLKAEKEGALVNCATVSADARVCASTIVGKPVITLEKSGPETALLGQDITYNIVVKNTGTTAAKSVVVSDAVPAGMSHSSGKNELTFDVGDLAPGQSKPLAVTFKANQRGKVCNVATATSSNASKVSDDACTTVLVPGMKVEKTGTKEQILGRNADYEIVVSNTGDTTLNNITISDVAPSETSIVTAPGATLSGNKATWAIASLAPGAKVTQTVKLTSKTPGTHCNTATASSGALKDTAKSCTLWKGVAAVLLEVVDDPDPIQIGESTVYTIKVTNQGTADIHNMKVSASFGDQVMPVSSPQGNVSAKSVNFTIVDKLAAKQSVSYTVTVKGSSVGDSRNKISLTADELKTPVTEEESTTIY